MSLSFHSIKMDISRQTLNPRMIFLAALFAVQARAHMIMANPVPYSHETIDNSPLTSSNYPCKVTSDPATFYSQDGIDNTYAAGSVQTLSFKGSAVHGGGSCQLAITNDMQPSADTDWRVILSIESGCPSTDGTSASTYNWTVPEDLEAGQYSFAWTWISKLAGQPEYYMNCAPITVTSSGSSKRSELVTRNEDYPELFVANLDSINSCKTSPGTDVVYPDPGPNVEKLLTGATPSFATISSAGCVPSGQSQGSSALPTATAGGSGSSGGSAGNSASGGSGAAVTTSAAASTSSAEATATTATSNNVATGGGVFATTTMTKASSTATITATPSAEESATTTDASVYVSPIVHTSSSEDATTATSAAASATDMATSSSSSAGGIFASSAAAPTSSAAATSSSAAPSSASTTLTSSTLTSSSAAATATGSSSGSASQKSGTCTDEGTFNCVGDEYQQCASGAWTDMRALPSGTTCQQGESTTLWARGVDGVKSRINVNLLRRGRGRVGTLFGSGN